MAPKLTPHALPFNADPALTPDGFPSTIANHPSQGGSVSVRTKSVYLLAGLVACSMGDETEMSTTREPRQSVVAESDIPSDIDRESWARVAIPDPDTLDADGRRAYDVIVNPDSRYASGPRGPITAWLYSPLMAEHVFPASTYLRFGTEKDQRLTELTILTTAREVRSQYEWTAHEPLARRAGLEQEIIDLLRRRGDLDGAEGIPGLGAVERTIVRFAREAVSEEKVSSDTYADAMEHFGQKGVMDLAGLVGYYNFVNITLKAFDVQLAPGRERLLPDLW
jgi:4-carboxymuconolactone decarboxylase